MKRIVFVLLALVVGVAAQAAAEPAFQADPAQVVLDKKAEVHLKGTGFPAGLEVAILLVSHDGVTSDIGFALEPEPKADEAGDWAVVWKCGRFVSKKLVKAGTYTLKAADPDYNVLAETTVTFVPGK
ncbi:MAG: hypothetical protein H5U10_14510 [Desulfacinum sp.]|jgi:hypothetical protein|nr:hypothetical protein [Desulfacinum sp.]MBZ4658847.1 hypothetical protein [Desulfacinum sp.]